MHERVETKCSETKADKLTGEFLSKFPLAICCPSCNEQSEIIGPLVPATGFAGRLLQRPLEPSALYRCNKCNLGFRWPRISKEQLDLMYLEGSNDSWAGPMSNRPDFEFAKRWILRHLDLGAHILDIGCFDGAFLQMLTNFYKCSGIEIHNVARQSASQKGIQMIGSDFDSIAGNYDCITAFDIIEHSENPSKFINGCLDHLAPGGLLFFSTGNLDACTFRFMGSGYWYCNFAEHISFINPAWIVREANRQGFQIMAIQRFSHRPGGLLCRLKQLLSNILYRIHPRLIGILRGLMRLNLHDGESSYTNLQPPSWITARDHLIAVICKC